MKLLALQPYDATSHRALLTGWRRYSRHEIAVLSLPGRHFKWRMRQAPIELARQIEATSRDHGQPWDALWCTSMLDLSVLRGLSPAAAALPAAVYFHENQLSYPTRHPGQRDAHFGITNMTTALAAVASHPTSDKPPPCVWWNSAYNRDSFLDALDTLLKQMPDHRPMHAIDTIRAASLIQYPGIDPITPDPMHRDAPPLLVWAARWEYDKAPELFFDALDVLQQRGVDFHVSVIGEQFAEGPACFRAARQRLADRIVRWGYQDSRSDYEAALREADVVVSTARHEFFGLAVAEAVSAGCVPVLPDALVYPEVWADAAVFHDQTPEGVADAIERAIASHHDGNPSRHAQRFAWSRIAPKMDDAIEALASRR